MSFDQTKYINDYNKSTYKMYQFRVRKDNKKMIKFLDGKTDRNSYITSLINKDINTNKTPSIKQIKDIIQPIMIRYGIKDIYLFGSYARGEANNKSDVDIYCEKGNIKSLIDQGMMEDELEEALNKKVDVIFDTSVKDEFFESQIMEDLIKIC